MRWFWGLLACVVPAVWACQMPMQKGWEPEDYTVHWLHDPHLPVKRGYLSYQRRNIFRVQQGMLDGCYDGLGLVPWLVLEAEPTAPPLAIYDPSGAGWLVFWALGEPVHALVAYIDTPGESSRKVRQWALPSSYQLKGPLWYREGLLIFSVYSTTQQNKLQLLVAPLADDDLYQQHLGPTLIEGIYELTEAVASDVVDLVFQPGCSGATWVVEQLGQTQLLQVGTDIWQPGIRSLRYHE